MGYAKGVLANRVLERIFFVSAGSGLNFGTFGEHVVRPVARSCDISKPPRTAMIHIILHSKVIWGRHSSSLYPN